MELWHTAIAVIKIVSAFLLKILKALKNALKFSTLVLSWLHTKRSVCFRSGHRQLLGQQQLYFSSSPHELSSHAGNYSWKQNSQRQIHCLARGWGHCSSEVFSLFFWCSWEWKESLTQLNTKYYWMYFKEQPVKRTDLHSLDYLIYIYCK